MTISAKYDPNEVEDKWYRYWIEQDFFHAKPDDRKPYSIVIPPPNITGVLHMGHMLNNTIQDVLVRRARLQGKNALWVPGTDHASIATEAKVVEKLKKKGIEKNTLSRESFLKHAWEWKEEHGGIILKQLKKLGASCDWIRTKFTMDNDLSKSVIKVFVDLYEKGYIYRGIRMVNWDTKAQTAVSDEEVIYREEQAKLFYIEYIIEKTDNKRITIATTRPETMLGDTAVCVNPNDKRFKHLVGKKCMIPLINRIVPIIEDDYVDVEFGTGCLKITPAHDMNDYIIGLRHSLDVIDIFTNDGKLNENAQMLIGEDRFVAREKILSLLEKANQLKKTEDYTHKVGYSERTNVAIEPKLSKQWFLKMKDLAKPALENVMNDNIRFHPSKFKNMYNHWMVNIKDWCISRQLWWGHRIPVYYLPNGDHVVAEDITLALEKANRKSTRKFTEKDLQQDEDVLDTWFSSWLWPISVFDGIRNPENKDYNYYYPTDDLITAPEIIFFWVARMIMAGYEYNGDKPFKNVYFTGIVRDNKRRKMSKQLGNSPDPLLMIKAHGADAVRVGMLLAAPAGNDLLFDESLIIQGRNFANKVWNIFRLIKSWEVTDKQQSKYANLAEKWFENTLQKNNEKLKNQFAQYRISEALMTTYTLLKEDFSSWYLEIIKPSFGDTIDEKTYNATLRFFEHLLMLLHPFMPFITEEIWQQLRFRKKGESIMIETFITKNKTYSEAVISEMGMVQEIVIQTRNLRKENNIPFKNKISLCIVAANKEYLKKWTPVIVKAANLTSLSFVKERCKEAASFRYRGAEFFILTEKQINTDNELLKLYKEVSYAEGFLKGVIRKLDNPDFLQNAPLKIIERERKKKTDTKAKLQVLKERIKSLTE